MAYVNTTRNQTQTGTLQGRIAAMIAGVRDEAKRRRVYSRTLRELEGLSDRDLADLGMHRLSIRDIARIAAYGA